MRGRAKSSTTVYPIWVEGEYITEPPVRPSDGAVRSSGDYIDKGGYPGANVYEVDMNTFCIDTGKKDRNGKTIYAMDILLYESENGIAYLIVQDGDTIIDIITGEVMETQSFDKDIKVIGNIIDTEDFIEGIRHYDEMGISLPYFPCLNVQLSPYPYFFLECENCGVGNLYAGYTAHCPECGGFMLTGYVSEIKRKKPSA